MSVNTAIKSIAIFLLGSVLLYGCATQSLKLSVIRPAEINLKGFDKIAIGDIEDQNGGLSAHSKDISDKITSALFDSKRFEVLDRQHLGTLLKEHNLTASGLVDDKTAAELGQFIGAAVFVFGRIQTDKYAEETGKDEAWTDNKGKSHQTFWRRGQYTLQVHLSVVDLKTSKVLAIKDIPAVTNESTSADRATPDQIDAGVLYTQCIDKITADFLRIIAPYQVTVTARFITDGKVPELQQAIAYFKAGEWDSGISLLGTVTQKDLEQTLKAKVFYNMGLAQMYSGKNDEAIENLKQAMTLDPKKSTYLNALSNAKKEKEIADKLKQQ